jgi:hypothetical protein
MKRLFACCFAWLVLALGSAQAVPARPRCEPLDPPKPSTPMLDLRNTTWPCFLQDEHGHFYSTGVQLTFEANGTLTYRRHWGCADDEIGRGSWKVTGVNVEFDINNYVHYRGTIAGEVIQGESTDMNGTRVRFRLQRGLPEPK